MSKFLIILSIIFILVYYYIGSQLIGDRLFSTLQKFLVYGILLVFAIAIPGTYVLGHLSENESTKTTLFYFAFTLLGFSCIAFTFFVVHDFFLFLLQKNPFSSQSTDLISDNHFITRKDLLFGFAIMVTGYGFYQVRRKTQVKDVTIKVPDLHTDLDGFRIVQISDVHIGPTIKKDFMEEIVEQINSLKPDMVAITGDLVDGPVSILAEHVKPLSNLQSTYGTFFVTGNHEYYSGAISWIRVLKSFGINVLLNENQILTRNNAKLMVAGVTDYKAESIIPAHKSDPVKAISGAKDISYKVLLAHQPNSIFEGAKAGFDLQLSGHTHGGQFFPGNILIHLFQKFVKGLYKHENCQLYVSCGTGYWGPPMRHGAMAEITHIRLKKL